MRINVYSQELITEGPARQALEAVTVDAGTGVTYSGVRMFLHSAEQLHHREGDDDRSALTFWLPKSLERREWLAAHFELMAHLIRDAPPETGLD
jgi:hypothetical protein